MFESGWSIYYNVNWQRKGELMSDDKRFLINLYLSLLIMIFIVGCYSCTKTDPAWLQEFPESDYIFPNAED